MDEVKQFASIVASTLTRLAEQTATINPTIFAVIFLALFLLAVTSQRLLTIFAATLLAAIGYVLAVAPGSAAAEIALGAWLGSLLVTASGIRSRRREIIQRRDFEMLKESVRNLETVAERAFLQSINVQSPAPTESGEE